MKTFKQLIAEVEEPKTAGEKGFKDKHIIQKTADVAGNDDAVYKGSKVKKDKSKKSGHEDGEDKEVYEETEEDEATEGRRPKSVDGEEEGGEHIAMQLRKAITMRGQKSVKFNDGKETKVSVRDADKFFQKFNRTRMSKDKIKMTRDAAKSYDHFKKIIGEDEVKELSTKTLGNYISKASDASKHRGLPIRKVDNRYSGVSKASKKLDQRESVDKEELDEAPKMKYALVGKDMKIYSMGSDERDLRLDRRSLEKRFKNVAPLKMARLKTAQSIGDKVDKSQLKEEVEIDEGMMKNMAIDLKDLPSDEFQRKYNMSKADAERKYGKPESVQIDEVKIPPYKEVMKVIGHTKNAVEGRAALKKKYGVTDKQADEIIRSTILGEKTLTPAEKKKREEVAQAIQRDNPDMPMDKKMAIATATAKKVAEETLIEADAIDTLQKAAKSRSPMRIKFDSGTSENIDKQTAEQLLDVHKKLNSSNKKRFEQNLFKSSLDFMKMVDFAVKKAG